MKKMIHICFWMMIFLFSVTAYAQEQELIIEYGSEEVLYSGDVAGAADELIIEDFIIEDFIIEELQTEGMEEQETEEQETEEQETEAFLLEVETEEVPEGLVWQALEAEGSDMLVMGCLQENRYASDANIPAYGLFSGTVYSDAYGKQLTGLAAGIYEQMVETYIQVRGSDQITYLFDEPYVFPVPDLQIVESTEGKMAVWDSEGNEAYQITAAEIRFGMQAAYDALVYDYPEVFWIAAPSYAWNISFFGSEESGYLGRISKVTIKPKECYPGASTEIAIFDAAVDAVSAQIGSRMLINAKQKDRLRVIHDYLCDTVVYGETGYGHTAAGVFLKDRTVVCEGYSKAFKILCRKFDIDIALIPGSVRKGNGSIEPHMWNYVRMDDGKWYLVDVTWDDQKTYISGTYFLAGNTTKGFVDFMEKERTVYSRFSGGENETQAFVMPALSEEGYGMHSWESERTTDREPTCMQKGLASIHCSVCGERKPGSAKTLAVAPHTWETEARVDQSATCTAKGIKNIHCSVCGKIKNGSQELIDKLEHTYGKYKVTREATVLKQGLKTRVCSVCGKKQYKAIAKLKRTIKVNVTALKLQVGQTTTAVEVSGLAKGDSVASWKSDNTGVATVSKSGRITAKSAGKAVITVTLESRLSRKITVTVQKKEVKTTKITDLPARVTIKKGKTFTLAPVLKPVTSQQGITYTSKNKEIATVDQSGTITAKKKGTVYIVVQSGNISEKVKVIVK